MIPKIIHYCWFGGNPLSELTIKCIESWKKFCPDYEIIEWNERNFNINYNQYCKEAYNAKKFAFVSDVARLKALCEMGGIYLDTDVEIIKPLDDFLKLKAFGGFENMRDIGTAVMACEKNHPLFQEFFNVYKGKKFINEDGTQNIIANVTYLTEICTKYGFVANNKKQNVNEFVIFPKEYFSPKDYDVEKIIITDNSHTIHHFNFSWYTKEQEKRHKKAVFFRNKFGRKFGEYIFLATEIPSKIKEYGFKDAMKRMIKR